MTTGKLSLMTLIAGALVCGTALAGGVTGSFSLGTGYLDNPLGLQHDTSAGYLAQSLRLATTLGGDASADQMSSHVFKLGYEGNASQFANDTNLGNMRHGVGVEWLRTRRLGDQDLRTNSLSAGVQLALRGYEDFYEIYDYRELYGYLAFRQYAGPQLLWSGFAALRARRYGELPEESFLEPHGQVKLQRFFASRTTLELSARYGVKTYYDSAASVIWDTPSLPSTSQMAARLKIAQGLSDRTSLRGRVDSRWALSDFPYYVAEDIFDSPLLDSYAHEGWDVFGAVKWIGPGQVWLEMGGARGRHDYGEMLFATATAGQTRDDTVREYFLSLERSLPGAGAARLRLVAGWRDQNSSIAAYTYDGVFASSTLSWPF